VEIHGLAVPGTCLRRKSDIAELRTTRRVQPPAHGQISTSGNAVVCATSVDAKRASDLKLARGDHGCRWLSRLSSSKLCRSAPSRFVVVRVVSLEPHTPAGKLNGVG
jgi:hypothetical protein